MAAAGTLIGAYADFGLLDAQPALSIASRDSSVGSTFAIPAIRNAAGTHTLNANDTFGSSTDGAVLTVTALNPETGYVIFSVQHQYTVSSVVTIDIGVFNEWPGKRFW